MAHQKKAKHKRLRGVENPAVVAMMEEPKSNVLIYIGVGVGIVGIAATAYWIYTKKHEKESTSEAAPTALTLPVQSEYVPPITAAAQPASPPSTPPPAPATPTGYDLYAIFNPNKVMSEVKLLQKFLNSKGAKLKVDGKYGPATKSAANLKLKKSLFNPLALPKNLKEAGEMDADAKSFFYKNGTPWIYLAP